MSWFALERLKSHSTGRFVTFWTPLQPKWLNRMQIVFWKATIFLLNAWKWTKVIICTCVRLFQREKWNIKRCNKLVEELWLQGAASASAEWKATLSGFRGVNYRKAVWGVWFIYQIKVWRGKPEWSLGALSCHHSTNSSTDHHRGVKFIDQGRNRSDILSPSSNSLWQVNCSVLIKVFVSILWCVYATPAMQPPVWGAELCFLEISPLPRRFCLHPCWLICLLVCEQDLLKKL